jgi:hypothetical protein
MADNAEADAIVPGKKIAGISSKLPARILCESRKGGPVRLKTQSFRQASYEFTVYSYN